MNNKMKRTGSHDDELADTSVEGLGSLVSTLLELLEVRGLLHEIKDLSNRASGEDVSLWVREEDAKKDGLNGYEQANTWLGNASVQAREGGVAKKFGNASPLPLPLDSASSSKPKHFLAPLVGHPSAA